MRVYLIEEIKEIRKGKGFSRERLANKICYLCKKDFKKKAISTKTIQRAEEGKPIKRENAYYIAKALDMKLEDIIYEKDKDTNDGSDKLHLAKVIFKESDFEIVNKNTYKAKQLEFEFSNDEKLVFLIDNNNRIKKIISTLKQDVNDIQCLCMINRLQYKFDMVM